MQEATSTNKLQPAKYKTRMCRHLLNQGVCHYMARCVFAHSAEELRSTERNEASGITTEEALRETQMLAMRNADPKELQQETNLTVLPPVPLPQRGMLPPPMMPGAAVAAASMIGSIGPISPTPTVQSLSGTAPDVGEWGSGSDWTTSGVHSGNQSFSRLPTEATDVESIPSPSAWSPTASAMSSPPAPPMPPQASGHGTPQSSSSSRPQRYVYQHDPYSCEWPYTYPTEH